MGTKYSKKQEVGSEKSKKYVRTSFLASHKGLVVLWGITVFAIASFILLRNESTHADFNEEKKSKQHVLQHNSSKDAIKKAMIVQTNVIASSHEEERLYFGSKVVKSEILGTNDNGIVVERVYTADGKKHRINHTPLPIFRHPSDSYLALMMSAPDGAEMPPLPDLRNEKNLETMFRESLKDPIVISDEDTAEARDIKQKVILARESMSALLNQGWSFAEVIEEERKSFNNNHDMFSIAAAGYTRLLNEGDEAGAETYRTIMNEKLVQLGISEIPKKRTKNNENSEN